MRSFAAAVFLLPLGAAAANAPATIPVDDSYTVSQRYEAYKAQWPELQWPVLTFAAGQRIQFDRRYKKIGTRELHVDVFLPVVRAGSGTGSDQGIVLVHGGGWRSGNKSNFYAIANGLAQRGYAVFLPEFRLSPEARYPAGLVDVSDAIVWVKAQSSEFGVDPARIALGGESSGGQMAAVLAYASALPLFKSRVTDDTRVNALIDLDGVLDFTSPLALKFENAAGERSPAAFWLGGSMQRAGARWREASATTYVGAGSPRSLVVASGEPRFTAGIDQVRATLGAHGVACESRVFPNTPHAFWLFEPYSTQIVDLIDSFLRAGH